MAYRELGMVEIREVLRRWLAGDGLRAIARGTGIDRKTIAKYVRAAAGVGLQRGGPLPTDEQVAAVRHQACPPAIETPSDEQQALWPHRETIQTWLGPEGLRLTKVARRLRALGVAVSYSTLYRFARACPARHVMRACLS